MAAYMVGNGPHVLGNGLHSCTQFTNRVMLTMGRFILAPIGLGKRPHVLGNGPHVVGIGPCFVYKHSF